ncbi:MAG: hypothetical protein HOP29_16595 [Phycisphaerales bacterium]|nr:hypothetical protein [Phycisphaerales bacterium]
MLRRGISPFAVAACITLLLILTQSIPAVVFLLSDGLPAMGIVAAATLTGTWLVRRPGQRTLPLRWVVLLGAGMGLGLLATVVLIAGCAGLMNRTAWFGASAVAVVAAIAAGLRLRDERAAPSDVAPLGTTADGDDRAFRWLWLTVAPFAAVAILAAVVPAGFLWVEEGNGYDVLEYHLQLPREYLASGRIGHAPHNVYGSFPANAEMLYLLCMLLQGDAYTGAAVGQLVNLALGGLCVFAAYVAGAEFSPRTGTLCGVLMGGVGWMTYLSGIAYVENGMMLFAMIATAAVVRAGRLKGRGPERNDGSRAEMPSSEGGGPMPAGVRAPSIGGDVVRAGAMDHARVRWVALAGGMAGFACGFKYSAVGLVWLPLLAAAGLLRWPTWMGRVSGMTAFGTASLLTFSPWLIRNAVTTGNPVFPLANSIFRAYPEGWGEAESAHFAACHQPGPGESGIGQRLAALWDRVVMDRDQRFGPLVLVLAAARLMGLIGRVRDRMDRLLGVVLLVQVVVWLFGTHLYARFAVPMAVPLVLLAGRCAAGVAPGLRTRVMATAIVVGMAFSAVMIGRLYWEHVYADGTKLPLEGAASFFLDGEGSGQEHLAVINRELPGDARILMIGDARAFYFRRAVDYWVVFNRNPFVEQVRGDPDPVRAMAWLRGQGYTHVLVHWAEIGRLRRSRYGFAREIGRGLLDRLVHAGLEETNTFATGVPPRSFATLYRVH